jgi:hypothetical protein
MTSVDRLGFFLRLKTDNGMKGVRINFPHEATTPQQTRAELVEMVRQAKASGGPGELVRGNADSVQG